MASDQKHWLRQLLSAAAVVVSLLFVGLEVRNNTAAVRGSTMQAISDASVAYMAGMALDEEFADLLVRVFEGATRSDLTRAENQQLDMTLNAFVRMLENTYLQHRAGLVPDAVFDSYGWNDGILRTAYFREWWEESADRIVNPAFKRFFESRVRPGP